MGPKRHSIGAGLLVFAFGTFAVSWAWINFSWFASAYEGCIH
jgi:hypothetical protein